MNKKQKKQLKKVYNLLYGEADTRIVSESEIKNFKWYYVSEKGEKNEPEHSAR